MAAPTDYELRRASEFMRELSPGQNWTEALAQLLADHRELAVLPFKMATPPDPRARFVVGDRVVPRGHKQAMDVVWVMGTVYRLRDSDGGEHVSSDGELIPESEAPWARKESDHV